MLHLIPLGVAREALSIKSTETDLPVHLPFSAAVAACHAVVPAMIEKGAGHIVNLTSPAEFIPFANMMPYTSARHAIVGLSNSMHYELKEHGIRRALFCLPKVILRVFIRFYQIFPSLSIKLMNLLGLWQPTSKR